MMNSTEVLTRSFELIEQIKKQEISIYNMGVSLEELRKQQKRAAIFVEVVVEEDSQKEEFKKDLSNAKKRSDEIEKRLSLDNEYSNLLNEIKGMETSIKIDTIVLGSLSREFRFCEIFSRIQGR